jgi:hypothetical protein
MTTKLPVYMHHEASTCISEDDANMLVLSWSTERGADGLYPMGSLAINYPGGGAPFERDEHYPIWFGQTPFQMAEEAREEHPELGPALQRLLDCITDARL